MENFIEVSSPNPRDGTMTTDDRLTFEIIPSDRASHSRASADSDL